MASHPAAMIHKMIQAAKKSESNVGKVRLVLGTARDTITACGLAACQVTWAGGIIYTQRETVDSKTTHQFHFVTSCTSLGSVCVNNMIDDTHNLHQEC